MSKRTDYTTQLFGLSLFSSSRSLLLKELQKKISNLSQLSYIVTPNPEQVIQASKDEKFAKLLQEADYVIPDGVGLVWASRILSQKQHQFPLSSRIAGREVVADLFKLTRENQQKILVIGGKDYHQAKDVIVNQLQSGVYQLSKNGFDFYWSPAFADVTHQTQEEKNKLSSQIAALKPDIVMAAFGAPAQEEWLFANKALLTNAQVKLAMAVGGSIDYFLGLVSPVPGLMEFLNLEWFWRLITQPWRLKRQLRLIEFMFLVFKQLVK